MKNILMLVALSFVITGCSTRTIVNIQNEPFSTQEMTQSPTLKEVVTAILQAGAIVDWKGKAIKPGLIESTYARKNYDATVEITYTEQIFH